MNGRPLRSMGSMAVSLRSFCALSTLALVVAAATRAAGEDPTTKVRKLSRVAVSEVPLARTPGAVIDASNIDRYGDVGSPSIRWIVEHGVKLKIGSYRKVTLPPPLLEATRRYSAKVRLSQDGTHLVDHVAGLPFPSVDINDPQVAIRLMFNFESAIARDDLDVRNIECRTGTIRSGRERFRIERTYDAASRAAPTTTHVQANHSPHAPCSDAMRTGLSSCTRTRA
jgi:hypothetical protein